MHQYLKAIGFNNIRARNDLISILDDVQENFNHQTIVSYRPGEDFCEVRKDYGQCMGISLCGELDENDVFEPAYYFPYFQGSGISTYSEIAVERKIEKEQYVGMCEDSRIGISLIFTLQNGIEYMRERQAGFVDNLTTSVTLSGLSLSGTILLPVIKDESRLKSEREASDNRKTLTLDDIDTYSQVSRRLVNEDVFSIVDTYFMPYGIECDLYSIMGEILAVRKRKNTLTGVEVYQMKLNVNELQFDVCVPTESVMGEPEIGRRYKGTIWLQGYINF